MIFVSNGETGEIDRYQALCNAAQRPVKWVKGIKGREQALKHAAEISETDWFIVFPGKLKVNPEFDFAWQPNRFNEAKHYIFTATNPVNNLEYGHMAAVAYNKQLVLDTDDYGLDFTMSKLHDLVDMNSGVAEYNSSAVMTWRTAFREAIKLKQSAVKGDMQSAARLETWLTVAQGTFSEYSLLGARHGVEYYMQVNGVEDALMLSFSWEWLDVKFNEIFNK